ncbi:Ornithine decarboxylase [Cricetulus griseus]|uniref:Ornithine decarboxylase n=1 Tax=Cricetulus griseus TaxID=10029 RepID=G3GSV5_CRIGR|nr:Ornithine decarboxylase [Cricetulus griseus]
MMTFDIEVELMKVTRVHPKANLVLQIATDDSKAVCDLSLKFSTIFRTSRLLLERAIELNIDVIGNSFHMGSGCTDPETFIQALSDACCVFDMWTEVGFSMYLLDIGGGFPECEDMKQVKFEELTSIIHPALDKYIPTDSRVRVTAKPGRYYVASAFTLTVNITAKKRPSIYYVMSRPMWQLMKQIQNHGFPLEVEEQDAGTLPMSCAQESRICCHPAVFVSASINV